MTFPDPEEYAARVIELHGGKKQFFDLIEERRRDFDAIWEQDSDQIGRVLRVHLAVEHFLTAYLEAIAPNLSSIENVRLGFSQKIDLLRNDNPSISFLKPGSKRLNVIRNRVAHNLRVEVTIEDRDVFLSINLFSAMRTEGAKHKGVPPEDPVSVMEQFAMFAAGFLQSSSYPDSELWVLAAATDERG